MTSSLKQTAALMCLALAALCALAPSGESAPQTGGAGQPARGVFRVTLTGFVAHHETADDILEGDGKRDEVYIVSDVWRFEGGRILGRTNKRSVVMGAVNNQNRPPREMAGSASELSSCYRRGAAT